MKMRYSIVILTSLLLTGCAELERSMEQLHQEWIAEHCSPNAGYNEGLTQGLTPGKMPENNYADGCPDQRDIINSAYLKGFSEGIKSRPQEITINKNVKIENENKLTTK